MSRLLAIFARTRRSAAVATVVLGTVLTCVGLVLDRYKALEAIERWCYDRRARWFQFFSPPPSGRLVHVDIDDASLETIGRWPWPRQTLADLIDEVRLAGGEAMSIDVLLVDEWQRNGTPVAQPATGAAAVAATQPLSEMVGGPATQPGAGTAADPVATATDPDATLAAAIRRFGRVLIPNSFSIEPPAVHTPTYLAAVECLAADLELGQEEVAASTPGARGLDLNTFVFARSAAFQRRVYEALSRADVPEPELRRRLLPRMTLAEETSSLGTQYRETYRYVAGLVAGERFSRSVPSGCPPLLTTSPEAVPLAGLQRAAWASGYATYIPFDDGTIRAMPLWVRYGDRIYPQMDLAMACAVLGVPVSAVEIGRTGW